MLDGVYVGRDMKFAPLASEKGEGGEARVYDYMPGLAIRILKLPDDPMFQEAQVGPQSVQLRRDAQLRLDEFQQKLPRFPRGLPENVLGPIEPVYAKQRGGLIVGHTMRFIDGANTLKEYSDREFRTIGGISQNDVVARFIAAHATVQKLHPRIVLGDFNPLNVLVKGNEHYMIDAMSYQTPGFMCSAFLPRYVDPLNCREGRDGSLTMFRPHSVESDWYSFAVMLFEALLFVHPYDGRYRPQNPADRVVPDLRPLKRISVFHRDVGYPTGGIPWTHLSEELIHFYRGLFERDVRGVFDVRFLEQLRWTKCSVCGVDHARSRCPSCSHSTVIKEIIEAQFVSESVFQTGGVLVRTTLEAGGLRYVYFEGGRFLRHGDVVVCDGSLGQDLKVRVRGDDVIIAQNGSTMLYRGNGQRTPIAADRYRGSQPVFDSNERHFYWVENGALFRDSESGPVALTEVLRRQTNIWAGPAFGFGFFKTAQFQRAFLFDAEKAGETIVDLMRFTGRVLDIQCSFTEKVLWLFVAIEDQGALINRCFVIDRSGRIAAEASATPGDGSWLQTLSGKVAASHNNTEFLLSATDDDVIRLQFADGGISEVASFKDSADLAGPKDRLLFSRGGLYVVTPRAIKLVKKRS